MAEDSDEEENSAFPLCFSEFRSEAECSSPGVSELAEALGSLAEAPQLGKRKPRCRDVEPLTGSLTHRTLVAWATSPGVAPFGCPPWSSGGLHCLPRPQSPSGWGGRCLHAASFPPHNLLGIATRNGRCCGMVQRMGSGDRQHPSTRALLSDTGQVSQSLFFLICEMGMMVLCHRIAARISDNEFEVPGGC